ncbi:MAG: hypothetical protein KatS3mg101_0464 [Patescibacteria group bacterium]|nr:MAG: hypothetical protein KatS3mg101_0464 [Patescibacteria group bacterium]
MVWTAALTLLFYLGILRFRGYRFVSGLVFSFFVFYLAILVAIFFKSPGYLIFYVSLFIIGLLNLYYRSQKYMNTRKSAKRIYRFYKKTAAEEGEGTSGHSEYADEGGSLSRIGKNRGQFGIYG